MKGGRKEEAGPRHDMLDMLSNAECGGVSTRVWCVLRRQGGIKRSNGRATNIGRYL